MNNIDPLLLLTFILGGGLLMLLGRYAITGDLNEALMGVMATMIGGLISALATRKSNSGGKGRGKEQGETSPEDKGGEDDGG